MLRTILRYEARLLRADNLARIALGLFVVLMLYAGYSGGRYVQEQRAIIDTHQERHTERIASIKAQVIELEAQMVADGASLEAPAAIGLRHPYTIGSAQGQVVALPPGPLAAFAVGQNDLFPPALRVSVGGARSLGYTATLESPFKLLVGHFDLTFFFLFLYPLLIIALLFGLTTSEREGGMLRMLLAQPIRLTTLVTGKLLLRGMLLVGCVVLGTALVMGVFADPANSAAWARWLLWVVAALAYGAFWIGLAVFVDSRVERSATSVLVLAVCWLVLAVIVPSTLAVVASSVYPVPSRMEYISAMRTESNVAQQQGASSLAAFFEDHPEIAPVSDDDTNFAMLRVVRSERVAEAIAPIEARFEAQKAQQQRLIRALGYLSPTVLTQQAFLEIAGTGHTRHTAFMTSVHAFHDDWKAHFVPMLFANTPLRPADYDTLPAFGFAEPTLGASAASLAAPLLLMLTLGLLLGGAGYRRYRHHQL
ncbi:MAG: DUF3526 domain-containing protein [Bacteroidota bacterium]